MLGEPKLNAAIEADLAGPTTHAAGLDVDGKGAFRGLHAHVGAAILFESSGGQSDKLAHLPELRFALGGPELETTTIDNAAAALESRSYFIRAAGTDGYRIGPRAKLNKVMADRRASLDDETDVKPALRALVKEHFEKGAVLPTVSFPEDGAAIQDTPRLAIVVADPATEWDPTAAVAKRIEEWTLRRGSSDRLYPASLIWCLRRPGRELADRVEIWLAWKRVAEDLRQGLLGEEGDPEERREVQVRVKDALEACIDEVWGSYRFVALLERANGQPPRLKVIDLGAGHASAAETLSGRMVAALRSQALLDNAVGAGYLDRHWPQALLSSGAWPLSGLRQCFLDGSFTRLLDPDRILRAKIVEFVERGDFGLASGAGNGSAYERVWYAETVAPEEVAFEAGVYILKKATAQKLKEARQADPAQHAPEPIAETASVSNPPSVNGKVIGATSASSDESIRLQLTGRVPPEDWNRLGTRLIPKLRSNARNGTGLELEVRFSVTLQLSASAIVVNEIKQTLVDIGLKQAFEIETKNP